MKRFIPPIIFVLFLIFVCGLGWHWWRDGRFIETTDNAYIKSDITPISTKVSGYVAQVLVYDNQIVSKGDPLVRIEDHEFNLRLERGKNKLAERRAALLVAEGKRQRQTSAIEVAKSRLLVAEIESEKASDEFDRFERLYSKKVIPELQYTATLAEKNKCLAMLSGARANLQVVEEEVGVLAAEEKRIKAEIAHQLEELKLLEQQVADTLVYAPSSGRVGNRRVRQGQFVRPGSPLMALIPLNDVWVEANFKEVQLERMKVGQPVEITVDAYPDQRFQGRIQSLAPASGAEFSIIPPENASGNFTKIVQRIPVKIDFEGKNARSGNLLPGMSAEVTLDTRSSPKGSVIVEQLAKVAGQ
jgi:membrane fusion protein (multidrug efflux system)